MDSPISARESLSFERRGRAWFFAARSAAAEKVLDSYLRVLGDYLRGFAGADTLAPESGKSIHARVVGFVQSLYRLTRNSGAERLVGATADVFEFVGHGKNYISYVESFHDRFKFTPIPDWENGVKFSSDDSDGERVLREAVGEILDHLYDFLREHGLLARRQAADLPGSSAPASQDASPVHGPVNFVASIDDSRKPRGYYYYGDDTALVEMHYSNHLLVDLKDISLTPTLIKTGWWEPWIDILLRSLLKKGMSYVNAGANVGYHTILGAHQVDHDGKVFCFEANSHAFGLLKKTIFLNGYSGRTSLYHAAVSDSVGEVDFHYVREHLGGGGVGRLGDTSGDRGGYSYAKDDPFVHIWGLYDISEYVREKVRCTTLDDTVGRHVAELDVLHMDIEASEGPALLGARSLVARSPKLRIIFEWAKPQFLSDDRAAKIRQAVEFLAQQNFRFYSIVPSNGNAYETPPSLIHVDAADLMERDDIDNLFLTRD